MPVKLSSIVRYNVHTKVLELQIHFKDHDAKSRRYRLEVTVTSSLTGTFTHIK
jgi:hypothetical protein